MGRTSLPGGIDPDRIATRQEFAAALTAVREAAGLTVREVARAANISPSTVGGYFSGRHLPPLRPDGGVRAILTACDVHDPDELEAWQQALIRIRRAPGPRPGALPPPYRGLATYRPTDAGLLFGRDAEVARLAGLLTGADAPEGIVVLVGRAGSGKSSLVAAGLVPRLRDAGRPVTVLTPGPSPLRDLAAALAQLAPATDAGVAGPAGLDPDDVRVVLSSRPTAVRGLIPAPASDHGDRIIVLPDGTETAESFEVDRRPVIVVDQFEDVLTGGADQSELDAFVRSLAAAARPDARASVLIVLRHEAVPDVARFPDLAAALCTQDCALSSRPSPLLRLAPMDDAALRAVVLGPARRSGVDVDADLVEAAVSDVAELERRGLAPLPQLSHALLSTWRRGRRGRMTLAAYERAGGALGAVETAAESVYQGLEEQVRAALPGLLIPSLQAAAGAGELSAALQAFADADLLEVAADRPLRAPLGLIHGWPRLQRWLTNLDTTDQSTAAPASDRLDAPGDQPRSTGLDPEPSQALPAATGETLPGSTERRDGPWWSRPWAIAALTALTAALLVTAAMAGLSR